MIDKKIDKKTNFVVVACLIIIMAVLIQMSVVVATPNVAKLYCDKMNEEFGLYTYRIIEEAAGQRGVCVLPDNQVVDAWDFFTGKVATEYSYCAKKGYLSEIATDGMFSPDQQVCLIKTFEFLPSTKVAVEDMMGLDYKEQEVIIVPPDFEGHLPQGKPPEYRYEDFNYWDWRNPPESTKWAKQNYAFFDELNGWLTSIKDQGSCRACWSFGTMGATESKYKINSDDPLLNPDLSEQYLVSSCCEECGDCSGGSRYASFDYLVHNGVSDEQCFPYEGLDSGCTPCADNVARLWKIEDYDIAQYSGVNDLKQRIIDNGPVTIIMDWGGSWNNCIYRCGENKKEEGTHIVVIAGYNDTGLDSRGGYWIVKNSFGLSWPGRCSIGDGYFKLGFDTCNVGAIIYPKRIIAPEVKPEIVLNSPEPDFSGKQRMVNFAFTVYTKMHGAAQCYLIVDDIKKKTVTAIDGQSTTINYMLEYGNHSWRAECWEDKIGVKASSETRNFELEFQSEDGNQSTVVYISEPYNGYSGLENVTLKCEAYDTRTIRDLSLYINLSGWTMIITNDICDQSCFLEYAGAFDKGAYEWNCLAHGSQDAWAKENFTFNIVSEEWNESEEQNYSNGSNGQHPNGFYNYNGGIGGTFARFETSLGTCLSSSRRCWSPSVLQQCIDGKWGGLMFCIYGCNPSSLRCRICKEGERKCDEEDKNVLVCSHDSWKTQICESGCYRDECLSGSQDIEGDFDEIYMMIGLPLIAILVIGAIIIFLRRRNQDISDNNTKFMQAIKSGI